MAWTAVISLDFMMILLDRAVELEINQTFGPVRGGTMINNALTI